MPGKKRKALKFLLLFERQKTAASEETPLARVVCSEIAWKRILNWGGEEWRERLIIYNFKMN